MNGNPQTKECATCGEMVKAIAKKMPPLSCLANKMGVRFTESFR